MRFLIALSMVVLALAGCVNDAEPVQDPVPTQPAFTPVFDYAVAEPDMNLQLLMEDVYLPGTEGVTLHGRITRPTGDGPFPIIVQHTPYTAPGCATLTYEGAIEPPVGACTEGRFELEFARRGYAYVHADLRGTGSSDGCLDLRGQADIADIGAFADGLAAQPWSNGNVGFIGASYPGSTSHMAALAGSDAVKAVIPVVASTSFYHYHHNDGVPYNGNHALGGTNTGYTTEGVTPTFNPVQSLQKLANQPLCPHAENAVMHGGLDQSGDYYAWWQERNLRPLAETITTPVMMAQGLADWNVKPDHVASWFNDLQSESKVFIGGQWGHAYPASDLGACPDGADNDACAAPWGDWWAYATAFFDTYLKEIDTGMFDGSVAWAQDNNGTWHRSADYPLAAADRDERTFYLHGDGSIGAAPDLGLNRAWYACPEDTYNRGTVAGAVEAAVQQCDTRMERIQFVSEPLESDLFVSGVPLLNLSVAMGGRNSHLTVVMDILQADGDVRSRENYGYLNPLHRNGIDAPEAVPSSAFEVSIDFYTQEDLIKAGERIRLTLASDDGGRTIEFFDEGQVTINEASLWLPLRPADLQGTRL